MASVGSRDYKYIEFRPPILMLTEVHKLRISQALTGRKLSEETKRKLSESKRKKNNGRKIHHGYVLLYRPDHPNHDNKGYVPEHRLIMEKYFGRYLTKQEDVHHKNENKQDNRIENLQVLSSRSKHRLEHINENRKQNILNRRCSNCGTNKTAMKNQHTRYRPTYNWRTDPITGNGYWCNRCYSRYAVRRWRAAKKKPL